MEVSVLGFGASEIGEQAVPAKRTAEILGGALDAGLNLIDTAACYGDSEELIGRTVGHRRRDFYILSKCGHAAGLSLRDWSPELVEASVERSLKRLRTDYLDVIQLHSCDESALRQGDLIAALERTREQGKVRFLGYSGDGEGALYAAQCGAFDTLQISLSIADQHAIDLVLPAALAGDIGVIAKRPIANAAWLGRFWSVAPYVRPYRDRLRKLKYDFLEGAGAVATALRFTLSIPGVGCAIVGTSKPARWQQNAVLAEYGPLPSTEYEAIRARWRAIAPAGWVGQQ